MVDHIVDASELRGRVDIRVGVGRRRRWSDEAKGRIVTESYAPGAVVSEVARRHDISSQHLFIWRKAAPPGQMIPPMDDAPAFVPVVTEIRQQAASAPTPNARGAITIEIGGAVVRAEPGVDPGWLREVLRAVRAAA
jgi:transposase